jgi:surface protein
VGQVFSNGGGFSISLPSSPSDQTIKISDVANFSGTPSITQISLNGTALDNNVKGLATGDTNTWGLGNGVGLPTLTTLASLFSGAALLTSVPSDIPPTVTNLSGMFSGCIAFNQNLNTWSVQNVTNMGNLFAGCAAFNNGGSALWNDGSILRSLADVTTMSGMFNGCTIFNQNIGAWDTSNVLDMSSMFFNAPAFNQDIGNWNVSAVLTMSNMFNSDTPPPPAFNAQIKYWVVRVGVFLTNMFASNGAFNTAYYNVTPSTYGSASGTANTLTTPTAGYFGRDPPIRNPCFMKGSQILCLRGEEEVYRPVQELRKGDLVKTYRNGYLPIHMIGTSRLSNPGDEVRIPNRLYKCSKDLYPDLFEDLYITGCHSILVPNLTNDQWENTKAMLGNVYITDNHFRLMACLDEKAQPFKRDAMIDIYHIALENDDYYMNYGVYANGLLVETCSKRYLTELSNMRIIGEDEACYDTPKVNVFSELGAFVQTY